MAEPEEQNVSTYYRIDTPGVYDDTHYDDFDRAVDVARNNSVPHQQIVRVCQSGAYRSRTPVWPEPGPTVEL